MLVSQIRWRRLRRFGAAAAVFAVAAGSVAACSSSSPSSAGGAVTGTLHVLVSSADASDRAFRQLSTDFEAAYPGVHVDFSSVPNDAFAAARSSRLTAGTLDVTLGQPVEVPSYIKNGSESDDDLAADAGLFLDLSNQAFLKNFTPSVIDSLKYKGKSYTVPTGLSYYTGVFYNKKIFQQYGLTVPTTWAQFQAAVSTLKSHNVAPLGVGGKDSWPAGLLMIAAVQGLYPTADAKRQLAQSLWAQSASLTDPNQVEVLQRVQELYGDAEKNFAGVAYSDIPSQFASGSVAMTVDGTWNQTTIDAAVGGKFDYGYFPLPVSDTAADNAFLGGKVELRMVVPSKAPNKTAALAYLKFFSQPDEYAKFVKTTGFAPAEPNIPASDFLKSIQPYTDPFSPAWDTIWVSNTNAGPAAVFPFNYPAVAPMGTKSAADAAAAAQHDWAAGS